MRRFLSFIVKETKHITRDKRTMLMLFGMPIVMMLIFGFAITNDVKNVRVVVVMDNADYATQQVINRLAASEYFKITKTVATPIEAKQIIQAQKADMAIVFAPDFASRKSGYQLIVDGTDPNMAQQLKSAYNFVPAIMGTLLMLVCAMMTSISIVREKEKGTMEVLLVSPTSPLMIVVAKLIPYLVLAFVILTLILLMSAFVLGVPLQGSLLWIFVISAIYILLALSLGLLVSTVAKTQLVALLLSAMVLLMPIIMLSGMVFPIESMPEILQYISAIIPTRYYNSAMRKLMIMGVDIKEVYFELMVLMAMLVGLLSLALANFKVRLE